MRLLQDVLGRAPSRDGWRASGQENVTAAAPAESERAVNVETVEPLAIALAAWAEAAKPDPSSTAGKTSAAEAKRCRSRRASLVRSEWGCWTLALFL